MTLPSTEIKENLLQSDSTTPSVENVTNNTEQTPTLSGVEKVDSNSSIPMSVDDSNSTTSKRYDGVVIATKVLWSKDLDRLKKWMCFLAHSYTDKMKYDVVIFTSEPWNETQIAELQKVAHPAKLTVALEGPTLEEHIKSMTPDEVEFLYKRCNVTDGDHIRWQHHCREPGYRHVNNLGYAWQAEFRAYHIWNHPAIKDYKYMMWLDADAFVGKEWDVDPMQVMIENDYTVMYASSNYGTTKNDLKLGDKLLKAYNVNICQVVDNNSKYIHFKSCPHNFTNIRQIAGMHHITNLEVFRKDIHQQFLKSFTGDYKFSRRADDQLAVTIVGLMEQYIQNNFTDVPTNIKLFHEKANGFPLKIQHHRMFDCINRPKVTKHPTKFFNLMKTNWTGLEDRCGFLY